MSIDFEKIRIESIKECTKNSSNTMFDDIAKELIDVTSNVMKTMLIKYHESLNSTND